MKRPRNTKLLTRRTAKIGAINMKSMCDPDTDIQHLNNRPGIQPGVNFVRIMQYWLFFCFLFLIFWYGSMRSDV